MNSLKKGKGVRPLNFEGGPGVLGPGVVVPRLHHALGRNHMSTYRI